jgi:Phytanoyl-CoA dioxygenase (PhyH)
MALSLAFVKQAFGTIRRHGTNMLPYALGRFYTVRKVYSAQASLRYGVLHQALAESIFEDVDVAVALESIRRDSVYLPVHLPQAEIAELYDLAVKQPLLANRRPEPFFYSEVKDGHLLNGDVVVMGNVTGIQNHPTVERIAGDPKVMEVMSQYLKATPRQREIRLYWSFKGNLTEQERQAASQTVHYHFDVHSYNFAYAAYYLTDTDRSNGAHVMVRGSHRDKPISWLFGSANQGDREIESRYSPDRILYIEGKAGTGFWQDSSCYHKALPPENADRLLLQVRYY